MKRFIWLILFALAVSAEASGAELGLPILTTAQAVRQLSAEEAQRGYPVRIEGVVLYYRRGRYSCQLTVQDKTLGIFVRAAPSQRYELAAGDLVQIEGVSDPGKFAPMIILSSLRVMGHGALPLPREVSYERLLTGAEDCQWVKVRGVVHSAANVVDDGYESLHVDLAVAGGRILAQLPRLEPALIDGLIGAEVSVTGACVTIFNNRRQLLSVRLTVQDIAQLEIETPAPTAPVALPVRAINSLHQYNSQAAIGQMVKVHGAVLYHEPDKFLFIRDDTQALCIQPQEATHIAVGDQIEAVGFPASRDYSPILEDAICRPLHSGPAPTPVAISVEQAQKGDFANDLVQVEGQLLDYFPGPSEQTLVLQAGDAIFRASLRSTVSFHPPAPRSRLRLTGICLVQVGTTRWPQSFQLLLRSPADLQVTETAPWWTVPRLIGALGSTAALCIIALGWVVTLRRRVQHQTTIIQEKIKRGAVLEERTRLAREFHDTLEQQLAAIALQLQVVRQRFESSPAFAQRVLEMMESMLRHTRAEARHAVCGLRASVLENGTLRDALATIASYVRNGHPVEVDVTVSGRARPLAGQIENNLLRISQEAATNAVKHGQAKHVQIKLSYTREAVQLTVEDDGAGFETTSALAGAAGHFGLLGMHERAEKIGAQLEVASTPGRGARVGVVVPLSGAESGESDT